MCNKKFVAPMSEEEDSLNEARPIAVTVLPAVAVRVHPVAYVVVFVAVMSECTVLWETTPIAETALIHSTLTTLCSAYK